MFKHERSLWSKYVGDIDTTIFQNYHFIANDKINCIIDIVENNLNDSVAKFSHITKDVFSAVYNVKGVDRLVSSHYYESGGKSCRIYTIYDMDYLNSKYYIYVYDAEYINDDLTFVPYVTNSNVIYESFQDLCNYDYDVEIETQK
jgi:hypothetical protein